MSLPRVRISFNAEERQAVVFGLDSIANGLSGYSGTPRLLGSPIDGQRTRAFSDVMRMRLLHLRELLKRKTPGKIRLEAIQIALCAYGVRIAARKHKLDRMQRDRIAQKLEKCRKRAKRKAIKLGHADDYQALQLVCEGFEKWCNYFLIFPRIPQPIGMLGPKTLFAKIIDELTAVSENLVYRHGKRTVESKKVRKAVTLIISEVRRGRQGSISVRGLISDPKSHQAFLLERLSKKLKVKLYDQPLRHVESQPNRLLDVPNANGNPPVPAFQFKSVSDDRIIRQVARWCSENFMHWDPAVMNEVWQDAKAQLIRYRTDLGQVAVGISLATLIVNARPTEVPDSGAEITSYYVDWLLGWLPTLSQDRLRLISWIDSGFALARKGALSRRFM